MPNYSISIRRQWRSSRLALAMSVAITVLGTWSICEKHPSGVMNALAMSGGIAFISILPALWLHISYYLKNARTVLTADDNTELVTIMDGNRHESFTPKDVLSIERHINVYYEKAPRMDAVPWINYGYLRVELKNGEVFFLTSLMIDVLHSPLWATVTRYRVIPYIRKAAYIPVVEDDRQQKQQEYNARLKGFKQAFKHHSEEQLQDKINNAGRYEPEAIAAAKALLEQMRADSGGKKQP